ncbi:MAG: hypothetical protein ACYTXT_43615 [Nostoc sp.]
MNQAVLYSSAIHKASADRILREALRRVDLDERGAGDRRSQSNSCFY